MSFKKILIPIDGSVYSDAAIAKGIELAKLAGSEITLFFTIDSSIYTHTAAGASLSNLESILKAEKHPNADKLLVFQVKMGTEVRQVISGVADSFTPEEMVGKKVVVVANLKPRMLRGLESHGMLLFAGDDGRNFVVTTDAPDGEIVS